MGSEQIDGHQLETNNMILRTMNIEKRFVNNENMSNTDETNRIVPILPHLVKSSTLNDFLIFNTTSEGKSYIEFLHSTDEENDF